MDTVLAISPSTRLTGFAVFKDKELIDSKIYSSYDKWSAKKLRKILKYIEIYMLECRPTVIVVKIPDQVSKSKGFDLLIGGINVLCKRLGKKATYYCLADIKHACSKDVVMDKQDVMKFISQKYPELISLRKKSSLSNRVYNDKAIEAVGAGYTYMKVKN